MLKSDLLLLTGALSRVVDRGGCRRGLGGGGQWASIQYRTLSAPPLPLPQQPLYPDKYRAPISVTNRTSSNYVPAVLMQHRSFGKQRVGRRIRVSVDPSALPKEYSKAESDAFVALLAKEIMKRYSSFVTKKWIQTISLCLSDPASTRLFLSRSLTRSSSTTKWFSQLLWDIMETKKMVVIPIPDRDNETARKSLEEAILRVDRMRRPVTLTSAAAAAAPGAQQQSSAPAAAATAAELGEDESGRSTSGRDGKGLAVPTNGRKRQSYEAALEALLETPPICQNDVTETLDLYAKEMIPDEKLVPLLLKSLGYHSASMVNLLKFLHIPIHTALKKKIAAKEELRLSTEASLREEIAKLLDVLCEKQPKTTTIVTSSDANEGASPSSPTSSSSPHASSSSSSSPSSPSSPSSIFKRTARSGTVWETRPYSAEHCLFVEIDALETHQSGATKMDASAGLLNSIGYVKHDESSVFEWRRDASVDLSGPYKLFLSRLPDSVTVQSFVTAFKGCRNKAADADASAKSSRASAKKAAAAVENDPNTVDCTLSPVVGVHLVKEDVNRVASKILFDLPRAHAEPEGEMTTSTAASDAAAASTSSPASNDTVSASAIDAALSPTQQLSEVEKLCSNGQEIASEGRNKYKNLDNSRIKKTILKKTTPESYAFVLLDSPEAFASATAEDMRVLGVSIEKSATPVKTVQTMRRLIFEVRYDFISEPENRNISYVIGKLNESLEGVSAVSQPRWPVTPMQAATMAADGATAAEEAAATAGDRPRRRKEMTSTGPSQPAFIHIQCPSHESAWRVYLALKSRGPALVPGEVAWIESKHYRWVRTQSEALSAISSPMLVDHFFHKADKGFLMH